MQISDNFFEKLDAMLLFGEDNRFYATGFRTSFGCVVLTKTSKLFLTDARYESDARKFVQDFDVVSVTNDNLYLTIERALKKAGAVKVGYEENVLTVSAFADLKRELKGYKLVATVSEIEARRAVKSDDEIAAIAEAEAITYRAMHKVIPMLKPGVTEKEISDYLTYAMLTGGAEGLAFDNVVCFGLNTAVPHHAPSSSKRLEKNELILIDIGARFKGYTGDMTRTFTVGTPSEKLKSIHEIVCKAQQYALDNIRAGITAHEADSYAREYITANGYGEEFTHSLGHGVGLRVHEAPWVRRGNEMILRENMIITVEPGIYVSGLGGVRVEDLIVVKEGGIVNLTNFPKDIQM